MQIHQYWHSPEIPDDVAELIASFRDRNPTLAHRVYDLAQTVELIAEHFGERELAAFQSCAVPSMQSDYFRFCVVLARGGVYCDADFGCRSSLLPMLDSMEDGIVFENHPVANTCFFAFRRPGHPLLRLALGTATLNLERRIGKRPDVLVGPWIFTSLFAIRHLGSFDAARRRFAEKSMEWLFEAAADSAGSYEALDAAFDGITIVPQHTAWRWIRRPERAPTYKESDDHWPRWIQQGRSIYR